jgi:hypothetical protein
MTLSFEGACGSNLTFLPPTIVIPDLCEERTIPVTIIQTNQSASTYTVNLDIKVTSRSNPNLRLYFYAYAYFYSQCSYASNSYYVNDGKLTATVDAGTEYYFDISLSRAYGYGYLSVDEISGNKLRIRFSPEYAYAYDANWNYWNPNVPKQELIIDKPADKVINISNSFVIDDEMLNMIW